MPPEQQSAMPSHMPGSASQAVVPSSGLALGPGQANLSSLSLASAPSAPDLEANFQLAGSDFKETDRALHDAFSGLSQSESGRSIRDNDDRVEDTDAASILQNSEADGSGNEP